METFKHFNINKESTIDSLKKQYRKLAFQNHPDMGGTHVIMKEIIKEYEAALLQIGKANNKNYSLDMDYINIIEELIRLNMKNVEIEICGWFIYLHGTATKTYKEELKKLKFLWNPKKKLWYWKPAWYRKKDKKTWDMNKIRNTFGSQKVYQDNTQQEQQEKQEKAAITA